MALSEGPALPESMVRVSEASSSREGALTVTLAGAHRLGYWVHGRVVVVASGDRAVTSALYRFEQSGIPLSVLAEMAPETWSSACVASPSGVGYLAWDRDLALERVSEACVTSGGTLDDLIARVGPPRVGSAGEWHAWLNLHGWTMFAEGTEGLATVGYRPSNGLRWHLFALRAGLRWLEGER